MIKKKVLVNSEYSLMSARQRMSPFPNYMSMESVSKEMAESVGVKLSDILFFLQDRVIQFFQNNQVYEKAGRSIADLVHERPTLYAELVNKEDVFGPQLVQFAKTAGQTVGPGMSNQDVYDLYVGYEKHYKPVYAVYGSVWTMEEHLVGDLYAIIEKRIQADPTKVSDILNTLTKQPSAMVATIERKALLELALTIAQQAKWQTLIASADETTVRGDAVLTKKIQDHVDHYFWLTRDYEDPVLTFADIVRRLQESLEQNVQEVYTKLVDTLRHDEEKRLQYIQELQLTQEEQQLFAAMRDAAHLKELRKRYVSESLYYFDDVLKEIARRTYLSIAQVRLMRTIDVKRALIDGEDITEELNERKKLSLWRISGDHTEVVTGEKAQHLFDSFCGIDKNAKEFRGMPVSPGKAQGRVKIVLNPDECGKVERGDIIVSIQVVPSFSTAIMKAGGIICDGGHGVTSHPATLAREAGIPCIIQTRFAREVLKDGQMVEIDGYDGVARILEN